MSIGTETAKNTAEATKVAQDAIRRYVDESAAANRTYVIAWTATAQAAIRSAFDLQNASLQALRSMLDSSVQANRTWYDQASESLRKGQDATAKTMAASFDLVESMLPNLKA